MTSARLITASVLWAMSASGIAYTLYAMWCLQRFAKDRHAARARVEREPYITVLKPLFGDEPHLYEHLRSFCDQRYENFRVVFGVTDPNDAALRVVRRLQDEFPARVHVISDGTRVARNPKVANLLGMEEAIEGELVVIADSDMLVDRDYLQMIAAQFVDDSVGALTCVFGGTPNESVASRIGAMAITDEFCPSVLVASRLSPVDFCMGATVALRAEVLRSFGGFAALADCLADDYEIGQRVAASGRRIVIPPFCVWTSVPERQLRDVWHHEVRWARTVFRAKPAGYAGTIVLHYVVLSALALVVSAGAPAAWAFFAAAFAARGALHIIAQQVFALRRRYDLHLLPLRIVLSFGVWSAAFTGRRVGWRGTGYEVNAKGRLVDTSGGL